MAQKIEVQCDSCTAVIHVEPEELPKDCPSPFCDDGVMRE